MTTIGFDDVSLYEASYFQDRSYGYDPKREIMYRQEQNRIIARSNFGRILDVGCGIGQFLKSLDDRFDKFGIEPSEYAARKSTEKGITIFRNLNVVESDSMDVVVFRGTLQHINTPIEDLNHAARALRHGGLLAITATPDADSLVYRVFGNLPALDPDRNWVIFGHRELENILRRLGFEKIEVVYPYWGSPYARPILDIISFVVSLVFGYRKFAFPGNAMEIYAVKK